MSDISKNWTVKVYALSDPRTPLVARYIGKTICLIQRMRGHKQVPTNPAMAQWFKELAKLRLVPCCIVLHEFATEAEALAKESELINSTENLLNFATGITKPKPPSIPADELTMLEKMERDQIRKTLAICAGNKFQAAKSLGIGRQTLYNKINAYGLA